MVRILVAGDFCLNARMRNLNVSSTINTLSQIPSITNSVDYSLVNLECSVSNSLYDPICKCGPNLLNTENTIEIIKTIGFNAVTMANNHIADYGNNAMNDTFYLLKKHSLDYVGAGNSIEEARAILYKIVNNKKIAFINCCEHEFTVVDEESSGANPMIVENITRDIIKARNEADYVIVITHGGVEHYNLPTPRMQNLYRFFVEMGANVIINHHQHCYSGYEKYKSGLIFYGIGNFCFDMEGKRDLLWSRGYMVIIDIDKDIKFKLIPYTQCDSKIGVRLIEDTEEFHNHITSLGAIIQDSNLLQDEYKKLVESKVLDYLYLYNLKQNRFCKRLNKLGLLSDKMKNELLPVFLTKEKKLCLQSYFQCESHRELMLRILKYYC